MHLRRLATILAAVVATIVLGLDVVLYVARAFGLAGGAVPV